MSKKMTPCEKLGYKAGDKFELVEKSYKFDAGDVVYLQDDDGTGSPYFTNESVKDEYPLGVSCFLSSIKKVAKLKPAKQALADAIHQNGGWPKECHWMFAASNGFGSAFCWTNKPKRSGWNWLGGGKFTPCCEIGASIPNWHQCVLSRDEYFTAYPEQVKVDVSNETEHKVDAEMKSESEMTIKVGSNDWHKSGELPPVGEVCLWIGRKENGDYRADLRTGDRVEVIAHYKPRSDGPMVAVFAYESRESIGRQTDQSIAKCFSPLRTEREKAIDEMVDCLSSRWANCEEIAEHLYESGYRKEVK